MNRKIKYFKWVSWSSRMNAINECSLHASETLHHVMLRTSDSSARYTCISDWVTVWKAPFLSECKPCNTRADDHSAGRLSSSTSIIIPQAHFSGGMLSIALSSSSIWLIALLVIPRCNWSSTRVVNINLIRLPLTLASLTVAHTSNYFKNKVWALYKFVLHRLLCGNISLWFITMEGKGGRVCCHFTSTRKCFYMNLTWIDYVTSVFSLSIAGGIPSKRSIQSNACRICRL